MSTAKRKQKRRLRLRAGYTMIEVMIALGILAIGGSAIISLQKVSVMGAVNSQNLVNASSIASGYLGRMQGEASATWTPLQSSGMTGTIFNKALTANGAWIRADPTGAVTEASLTLRGRVDASEPTAYCSYVRAVKLTDEIYRLEVRTIYMRSGQDISGICALGAVAVNDMIDDDGITVNDGVAARHRDELGIAFVATAVRRGT